MSGLTPSDIAYNATRAINWKLIKDVKKLLPLITGRRNATSCSKEDLIALRQTAKSNAALHQKTQHIAHYLPRLGEIGAPGSSTTHALMDLQTETTGQVCWYELLRFLHYVQLPDLTLSKTDGRTGKEAQMRNQGLIVLKLNNCTTYTSGKIKAAEKASKLAFSHCLSRMFIHNQHLTSLDLSKNRLDDSTAEWICKGMAKSSTVVCLILSENRFSKRSLPTFQTLMQRCTALDKFHIANNPMLFDGCVNANGKEDVNCASKWLGYGLSYLDIADTGLSHKAALNVFRYLLKSESIRTINMSGNSLREISTLLGNVWLVCGGVWDGGCWWLVVWWWWSE
jgi:hypothetical protein